MINERENAMKKKNIDAVMAQFSDDATFINGEGYYLANKAEITAFHKGLVQTDHPFTMLSNVSIAYR